MPLSRISLTLSRHVSLLFIASGKSSGLHPVSSQSCCTYFRAGRPAFARPYVGVHRSKSLMLLQQCPACLVRLTWIVFVMGGRWSYSWCLVGCCRQDFFLIFIMYARPVIKLMQILKFQFHIEERDHFRDRKQDKNAISIWDLLTKMLLKNTKSKSGNTGG